MMRLKKLQDSVNTDRNQNQFHLILNLFLSNAAIFIRSFIIEESDHNRKFLSIVIIEGFLGVKDCSIQIIRWEGASEDYILTITGECGWLYLYSE